MAKYNFQIPKSRKTAMLAITLGVVLVLGFTIAGARYVYSNALKPVSNSEKSQLVTIPVGATAKEIAAILDDANLVREGWAFEWYVRNSDVRDKLQAGTYALRPSQDVEEIVNILTQGNIATDLVTILPGKRIDEIKDGLINAGFSPESVDAALIAALYADHPALADKPKDANLEGYIYPETFQKTAETKPETIIKASLDEMQKRLTPEIRKGFARQGLTVHEGVTLASIIEQEVNNAEDKPIVAQVFLKRRSIGMQLGSDVTAFYGAIIANQEPSVYFDSPYNTRLYNTYPPGPISNVSGSSLSAVVNPAPTNYLYFVAGDDGKTYFSNTLDEHESLTRQHCIKLCNQ